MEWNVTEYHDMARGGVSGNDGYYLIYLGIVVFINSYGEMLTQVWW